MNDDEFEALLFDRKTKIKQMNDELNLEENAYICFSGGKDSLILSRIVDEALPKNHIPRVFANTGIEYTQQVKFVKKLAEEDTRICIMAPQKNVGQTLDEVGYPFKSKLHSHNMNTLQNSGLTDSLKKYFFSEKNTPSTCPQILRYQATEALPFKISDRCCTEFKKKVFTVFEKRTKRKIAITGIRQAEHGRRESAKCVSYKRGEVRHFNPLLVCDNDFCDFFIKKFDIELSPLYYAPFNFKRTGCRGCPFNVHLRDDLETLAMFAPSELKAAFSIFAPVYNEYRRIGYRLPKKSFALQEELNL